MKKRTEQREVERARKKGAEESDVKRGRRMSGKGRKAHFPSLGDSENSVQRLRIWVVLKGGAEGKHYQQHEETIVSRNLFPYKTLLLAPPELKAPPTPGTERLNFILLQAPPKLRAPPTL